MDIMMGLSAISQTLAITKELWNIDKEMDLAQLKLRLSDLIGGLLEAKEALQDAKEERRTLLEEISALKGRLNQRGRLEDEDGFLYELDDAGNRVDRAYCNQCFVKEGKLFRLVPSSWGHSTKYDYTNCKFMHVPDELDVRS